MNWLAVLKTIAPKGDPTILKAAANAMPGICAEFDLVNERRQAHFLAQIAHESDGLKTTVEYASGAAYEGRADLGNTQPGDGKRFKGRALIQLTGRANYAEASKSLGVDFVSQPHLAAQFPHAIRIAGWYWKTRKLNSTADADNIIGITRKVNGGLNGLEDRKRYLARAKAALAKQDSAPEPEPAPSMTTSKTGAGAIVTTTIGGAAVIKEAASAASDVKDAASAVTSLGPWVLLGIVLIGIGIYLWMKHAKRKEVLGI